MRRREFIMLLSGVAAWPLAARAQQAAVPVIGFLSSGFSEAYSSFLVALRTGLGESGYVEGHNVKIEYRWAEGQFDRLPGVSSGLAARAATSTIPHVFLSQDDPVRLRFVASFNRPGWECHGCRLIDLGAGEKAARARAGASPDRCGDRGPSKSEQSGIRRPDERCAGGSTVPWPDVTIAATERWTRSAARTVALATCHAIPTIYDRREFATAGRLLTYGANFRDAYRQIGNYTGRILMGTKPTDLPVIQPTRFELVINVGTAKAIGLDVPSLLLGRADEVIE
jgi:putative ABC transport system substrate-binding protein